MKKVFINENKIDVIMESEEEYTFFQFFNDIKSFMKDLLNDPIHARPNERLKQHGISNDVARTKLQDDGIIIKSEKIDEPFDETTGKQTSRYYLSYKIPKKDFKKKIRRLYQKLF
jgi:hypothetical protein